MAPSHVPELRLHLAHEALPLWHKTEEELAHAGLPPPFWAFAWAGGQALARYVLDEPQSVRGKSVLDLGAGGGVAAIAAARAGAATVRANEVDDFALASLALNAAANDVVLEVVAGDLLGGDVEEQVVLAGDVFYERDLAERALEFLERAERRGALVLIGDPSRSYLPVERLQAVAHYQIEVTAALEDADVKRTAVWRLRPAAPETLEVAARAGA